MTGITWSGRRRLGTVVLVAMVAVWGVACSSGRNGSTAQAAGDAPAPALGGGAVGGDAATGEAESAQGATLKADALAEPATGRPGGQFISTATMTVEVDDVAGSKPKVVAAAEAAGGALFAEETSYGARSRSVITLKVPPAGFSALLRDIAAVGTLVAQQVRSEDVTQKVIDLDARINAASASLERTRDLLGRATSLTDIASLEAEVSRRQADLESLEGQRRTLRGRIDLATVVVTLEGPEDATPAARERRRETEPASLPGFLDGLRGGWDVLGTVAVVSSAVLGAALPFLPFAVLAVVGWRVVSRRRSAS